MSELLNKISISPEIQIDENNQVQYIDYGEAIIIDGVVYEKDSLTILEPTYSLDDNDIVNISGVVFTYDDNNDINGNCHKEWTAVEIAITSLPKYNSHKWETPNSGMYNISIDMCDFDLEWIAPESGILRINHVSTMTTKDSFSVFVNKRLKAKFASNFSTDSSRLQDAYAIQVVKGDVIYIPNIYSRVMLLPFVYNGE